MVFEIKSNCESLVFNLRTYNILHVVNLYFERELMARGEMFCCYLIKEDHLNNVLKGGPEILQVS
jgi:hypothetical protein